MAYEMPAREGRKAVDIECRVESASQRMSMRLSDLSAGGGFIGTPAEVERGDRMQVAFILEGREWQCSARVAHVQPERGFGFAFLGDELADEARLAIERFVDESES